MELKTMVKALEYLRAAVGELGIQQMLMLLTIMDEEGITQSDLAERFNFQQGSVSKNCKRLSRYTTTRQGQEVVMGMDLIKLIPSVTQFRRLECHLTSRGKQIRKLLKRELSD